MAQSSETDPEAAERTAIREVIKADTAAYLSKDVEAWSTNFLHDERMTSIAAVGRGILMHRGYEAFAESFKKAMTATPTPMRCAFEHKNMQITVMGDMAWAVFDQFVEVEDDPAAPVASHYEVRVLEKHEGAWRIVFHSFFEPHHSAASGPLIEVDAEARIVWLNTMAEEALPQSSLFVSPTRVLRSERSAWTRNLHAAIRKAAGLRHYYEYNRHYRARDTRAVLPVVFGEDEHGAAKICLVSVIDFRIYVSFDDVEALARRLAVAGIVFALSETQQRLAAELCAGRSIPAAATAMGMSPSTARTHLQRMFDKTGVHSQVALVRVLLSVGG